MRPSNCSSSSSQGEKGIEIKFQNYDMREKAEIDVWAYVKQIVGISNNNIKFRKDLETKIEIQIELIKFGRTK